MGVGHGSQGCTHDCQLPVMLRQENGTYTSGIFEAPIVPNSDLPGLLGLRSMQKARVVLDLTSNRMHLCGPGAVELSLPSGTETYQLETAPSGHLVLPCSNFQQASMSTQRPRMDQQVRALLVPAATETDVGNPQGS